MTPVVLVPDVERLAYLYLKERQEVQALNTRLVGRTPEDTSRPWTRLTLLDQGGASLPVEHLVSSLLQADVYAGSQAQVLLHARTIRAVLVEMPKASHAGAVVTRVRVIGMPRIPDTDFEPARERVILTVAIHAHPA